MSERHGWSVIAALFGVAALFVVWLVWGTFRMASGPDGDTQFIAHCKALGGQVILSQNAGHNQCRLDAP